MAEVIIVEVRESSKVIFGRSIELVKFSQGACTAMATVAVKLVIFELISLAGPLRKASKSSVIFVITMLSISFLKLLQAPIAAE